MTPLFCEQCGARLPAGGQFCEQCGAPAASTSPETHMASPELVAKPAVAEPATMEWVATLSILQNKVVVSQLGLVFFIPLLVLSIILALIIQPSDAEEWGFLARIVLITAAVFLGLLLVAILLVYGGRYEYEFRLNEQGIGGRPHGRTARKNRAINFLLLFSGNPTAAGAGTLAQARQVEYVAWKDIDTVIPDARHRTITLQKGKRPLMVVPCDEKHYAAVLKIAQEAATHTRNRK